MKQLTNLEDLDGKVIERVRISDNQLCIVCKDATFSMYVAYYDSGEESAGIEINSTPFPITPNKSGWNIPDLVGLGFLSEEEATEEREKIRLENLEEARKRKLRHAKEECETLVALMKKYPEIVNEAK
jgi:hypothetical protein